MTLSVGEKLKLPEDPETYIVFAIENGHVTRKADAASERYEQQLKARPMSRHLNLSVEEHKRGEVIEEDWKLVRMKSDKKQWNVFVHYRVSKEQQ